MAQRRLPDNTDSTLHCTRDSYVASMRNDVKTHTRSWVAKIRSKEPSEEPYMSHIQHTLTHSVQHRARYYQATKIKPSRIDCAVMQVFGQEMLSTRVH